MQPTPDNGLMLSAIRRTCQRLWNSARITAEEKRKAKAYYDDHQDDAHKLHELNKRMGTLITERTPLSQRPAA